jgi:hypothetical protein
MKRDYRRSQAYDPLEPDRPHYTTKRTKLTASSRKLWSRPKTATNNVSGLHVESTGVSFSYFPDDTAYQSQEDGEEKQCPASRVPHRLHFNATSGQLVSKDKFDHPQHCCWYINDRSTNACLGKFHFDRAFQPLPGLSYQNQEHGDGDGNDSGTMLFHDGVNFVVLYEDQDGVRVVYSRFRGHDFVNLLTLRRDKLKFSPTEVFLDQGKHVATLWVSGFAPVREGEEFVESLVFHVENIDVCAQDETLLTFDNASCVRLQFAKLVEFMFASCPQKVLGLSFQNDIGFLEKGDGEEKLVYRSIMDQVKQHLAKFDLRLSSLLEVTGAPNQLFIAGKFADPLTEELVVFSLNLDDLGP